MIRKAACLLLAVLMMALSMAGCATNPGTSPVASASATAPGDVATDAPKTPSAAPDGGTDPFGKYDQTVTISIGRGVDATEKLPDGDTPENNQYTRYIKDKLNIQVTNAWQAANGKDFDQKVNLSIASNDLPDGMTVNDTQFRAMIRAGLIADLKQAYETYASPVMRQMFDSTQGKAMENVTSEGKVLAMPNIPVPDDSYTVVWVRKDWLDKLGLKPPATLDDLKNIASEFIQKNPGALEQGKTIGIAGPQNGGHLYDTFLNSTNVTFGFDPVFTASGAYPGFWLDDGKGQPVYGSILPATKTALGLLADWYKQGLIDPQIGVRKDATEPVVGGQAGIFFGVWWQGYWPFPDAVKNTPTANWQSYMLKDGKGVVNNHMGAISTVYSVVRKDYKNPEALIRMLNLLIQDEGTFDLSKGTIGNYPLRVAMASSDEMPVTRQALADTLNGKTKASDYDDPKYSVYKLLKADVAAVGKTKNAPYDSLDISTWNTADSNWPRMYSLLVGTNPFYTQDVNKVYSMTYSQTPSMETKWSNLQKLEDETFLKIIMGAAPLSDFDTFVTNWKAQGGDEITKEVAEFVKK